MFVPDNENFQTPTKVADHMAKMAHQSQPKKTELIEFPYCSVLEPTPGKGHLIWALNNLSYGFSVYGPGNCDFWESWGMRDRRFDFVVMNPPFFPIKDMERFVIKAMELSDRIIMLLPWSYIINSQRRLNVLKEFGMVSITSLPRETFPGARIQTCIIHLVKAHREATIFKVFNF